MWVGVKSCHLHVVGLAVAWLALSASYINIAHCHDFNYRDALTKSILLLEAQRSGKLPPNNRIPWRGDSGLEDGKLLRLGPVGGYYDAGDNVKFGLPMAFTVTILAWSAILYRQELQSSGELLNVLNGIRRGTDYFLEASSKQNIFESLLIQ